MFGRVYSSTREHWLWALVVAIAALDLISTYIGIQHGLTEQNPFGDYLLHSIGFLSLVLVKIGIIGFVYELNKVFMPQDWRYLSPVILIVIWGSVSLVNLTLIFSVRTGIVN